MLPRPVDTAKPILVTTLVKLNLKFSFLSSARSGPAAPPERLNLGPSIQFAMYRAEQLLAVTTAPVTGSVAVLPLMEGSAGSGAGPKTQPDPGANRSDQVIRGDDAPNAAMPAAISLYWLTVRALGLSMMTHLKTAGPSRTE